MCIIYFIAHTVQHSLLACIPRKHLCYVSATGGELHTPREWEEPRDPGEGAELWHHQPGEREDTGCHLQERPIFTSPKGLWHGPGYESLLSLTWLLKVYFSVDNGIWVSPQFRVVADEWYSYTASQNTFTLAIIHIHMPGEKKGWTSTFIDFFSKASSLHTVLLKQHRSS